MTQAGTDAGTVAILGCRGIPARHGGFETFAEILATDLVGRGWSVDVYCQEAGDGPVRTDDWRGVTRHRIPVPRSGALGTVQFDLRSMRLASRRRGPILLLGYNTGLFAAIARLHGRAVLVNMDGLEWRRAKWSFAARAWLRINEIATARIASHLVADHPEIARHLEPLAAPDRITMIPYGAEAPPDGDAGRTLDELGLTPGGYLLWVARIEPDNRALDVIEAYGRRPRGLPLVMVGDLEVGSRRYHRTVRDRASPGVRLPGPIYDRDRLGILRRHAAGYLHGHRVGGTNPSLVEALAAGNPVLADDNPFNRWTAGDAALYFRTVDELDARLGELERDPDLRARLSAAAVRQHAERFRWPPILDRYRALLTRFQEAPRPCHGS